MVIAIQQPEHLSWVGFFNKMAQSDLYVYLDNVQFKKRYFENRNRIKVKEGARWVTVPVLSKGKYTQKINQVTIDNEKAWQKSYFGTMEMAYRKAPYWQAVKEIISLVLDNSISSLVELNFGLINKIREYLKINTPTVTASSLGLNQYNGSDLIHKICLQAKADTYLSGPDGVNYLKLDDFKQDNIRVLYHDFQHPEYPQQYVGFISHLSVIDLIANCGPESATIIRDCYRTVN